MKILVLMMLFSSCSMLKEQKPRIVYRTKIVEKIVEVEKKVLRGPERIDLCIAEKLGLNVGPKTSLTICSDIFGIKGE